MSGAMDNGSIYNFDDPSAAQRLQHQQQSGSLNYSTASSLSGVNGSIGTSGGGQGYLDFAGIGQNQQQQQPQQQQLNNNNNNVLLGLSALNLHNASQAQAQAQAQHQQQQQHKHNSLYRTHSNLSIISQSDIHDFDESLDLFDHPVSASSGSGRNNNAPGARTVGQTLQQQQQVCTLVLHSRNAN